MYLLNVIEERRGEERRGEARKGEARRGEERRGEEKRGEARRGEAQRESQLLHAPKLLQSVLDTWCRHPQYSTVSLLLKTLIKISPSCPSTPIGCAEDPPELDMVKRNH
ncbi:hypothetical protein ACLB2K_020028 [Fragaria x ananassa]